MSDRAIAVEALEKASDDHVQALERLLVHLSSARPPDFETLAAIAGSDATTLLFARIDGTIVGTLALAVFAVPTGKRAWIEDVVVDPSYRGQGVASALVNEALRLAEAAQCRTVDLTSRPDRVEANRLYEKLGFERRATNVFRRSIEY